MHSIKHNAKCLMVNHCTVRNKKNLKKQQFQNGFTLTLFVKAQKERPFVKLLFSVMRLRFAFLHFSESVLIQSCCLHG